VTDRYADGGPALRVAVVSDGRPTEAGPARPVIVVSDGRPTQGNEPVPIVLATGAQASQVLAGPAIPIVVVSGSLASNLAYTNKVKALSPIAYWPLADTSGTTATDESGNGRNGTYTATTLGQTGIGDGRTAASLDGSTSFVNMFSASLQAAFGSAEGTFAAWARVANAGVWTDAAQRRVIRFAADANNAVAMYRSTTNNTFSWQYVAGGTTLTRSKAALSTTDWFHIALTWSKTNNQAIAYFNGAQEGAILTGLGVWAGNLASSTTLVGATSQTPGGVWNGNLAHAAIWASALSAAQIATLAVVP
jgi:hypothetical protein